ncbi:multifunctional PTS system fructose-like transporter subunit IIA/phosphocarrier protein HPr/phosphoenolpyruvate-protein phosphotransferase, partial [Pseudomonas syringae pv. actinidiae ICMP 18804]
IAIGPAHVQVLQAFDYSQKGESVAAERERLHTAIGEVRRDIENLIQRSKSSRAASERQRKCGSCLGHGYRSGCCSAGAT